ncbi:MULTISPECIES: hypothetical protein [unclassified Streptomyces]|uniref:hypothetical protein n=1 Tax=unclassified Streptomyces TaxID=2593676 RepID=UPI000B86008D|nr:MULTISPECIES: hypothetical protein [unclassified Streptomyces]MYT16766.1 hypothetical protein [Streptomyces sp. SID4951]
MTMRPALLSRRGTDHRGHVVDDLIMLQTLSHRDAPDDLLDGYGLVIVDECHAAVLHTTRSRAVERRVGQLDQRSRRLASKGTAAPARRAASGGDDISSPSPSPG